LTVDRQLIANALQDVFSQATTAGARSFTGDQQQVIVKHICHATLKSTTLVTTFTSLFAAFLIVLEFRTIDWLPWILIVFDVLAAALLVWVLPKKVYFFGTRGLFGLKRDVLTVLSFCFYDVLLGAVSYWAVLHRTNPN
jgi:hypothetical protein